MASGGGDSPFKVYYATRNRAAIMRTAPYAGRSSRYSAPTSRRQDSCTSPGTLATGRSALAGAMWRGVVDAYRGQMGRTFPPPAGEGSGSGAGGGERLLRHRMHQRFGRRGRAAAMRIAIDTTAMPADRAGAGVYTYQLTRALAAALPDATPDHIRPLGRLRRPRRAQSGVPGRTRWEGPADRVGATGLPQALRAARRACLPFAPSLAAGVRAGWRNVVTVHDVTFRLLPWRYTPARRLYMSTVTALGFGPSGRASSCRPRRSSATSCACTRSGGAGDR